MFNSEAAPWNGSSSEGRTGKRRASNSLRGSPGPIELSDDEDENPPTGIVHAEDDPYPHGYGVYEDDEDEYEEDEA